MATFCSHTGRATPISSAGVNAFASMTIASQHLGFSAGADEPEARMGEIKAGSQGGTDQTLATPTAIWTRGGAEWRAPVSTPSRPHRSHGKMTRAGRGRPPPSPSSPTAIQHGHSSRRPLAAGPRGPSLPSAAAPAPGRIPVLTPAARVPPAVPFASPPATVPPPTGADFIISSAAVGAPHQGSSSATDPAPRPATDPFHHLKAPWTQRGGSADGIGIDSSSPASALEPRRSCWDLFPPHPSRTISPSSQADAHRAFPTACASAQRNRDRNPTKTAIALVIVGGPQRPCVHSHSSNRSIHTRGTAAIAGRLKMHNVHDPAPSALDPR